MRRHNRTTRNVSVCGSRDIDCRRVYLSCRCKMCLSCETIKGRTRFCCQIYFAIYCVSQKAWSSWSQSGFNIYEFHFFSSFSRTTMSNVLGIQNRIREKLLRMSPIQLRLALKIKKKKGPSNSFIATRAPKWQWIIPRAKGALGHTGLDRYGKQSKLFIAGA